MNRTPVRSGHLESIGYDVRSGTLEVEFKGGSLYWYFDVPSVVFEGLMALNESKGSVGQYFDQHVKKADFLYQEIQRHVD